MYAYQVIITADEVIREVTDSNNGRKYLAKRFKLEHGLDFSINDFDDEARFEFFESADGEAFKVIYIPPQAP